MNENKRLPSESKVWRSICEGLAEPPRRKKTSNLLLKFAKEDEPSKVLDVPTSMRLLMGTKKLQQKYRAMMVKKINAPKPVHFI